MGKLDTLMEIIIKGWCWMEKCILWIRECMNWALWDIGMVGFIKVGSDGVGGMEMGYW